jgi:hypothetical protein
MNPKTFLKEEPKMTTNETKDNLFGDVIYQYTRAQAIEDGVLIDVTETAREAGISFATAMTAAVWAECVTVPEEAECQDEMGRLWDVLTMLRYAIVHSKATQQIAFSVAVQNDARRARQVQLKALCGPGDQAEPVITIMMPNED